ncbi:MAG: DsbA family protein [Pseudomonadota bacterium]
MRVRAALQNKIAKSLFSIDRRNAKRRKAERVRRRQNLPHTVHYFHQAGDPYSHLMAQVLPQFQARYEIDLDVHITAPPPDWAAPDRARLDAYSRIDAARLARQAGWRFVDPGHQPDATRLAEANAALIAATESGDFLAQAQTIGDALWSGDMLPERTLSLQEIEQVLAKAAAARSRLGHYLGATLYYAGEWYWGPDRLHYLEERLRALGATKPGAPVEVVYPPPVVPSTPAPVTASVGLELHWYLSFRSPYTGIVAERVKALADAYHADLKLRFVLPMVMRGMQVPRMKGFYIMSDVVREAERLGVPFGNAVDPIGAPVERGYAILSEAIKRGRGYAFAQSFLSGVWRQGLDAGSDKGLKTITERAGLDWPEMRALIGGDHWRAEAEANRQEMFEFGVWGVPSFRIGDVTAWGQDRLWVIEAALKKTMTEEEHRA